MSQPRTGRFSTRPRAGVALLFLLALPALSRAQLRPPPTDFELPSRDMSQIGKPVVIEVPEGLTTPERLRFDRPFQQGKRCGPNGVFVMLRLRGIKANYDEVVAKAPLTDRGSDLESLRRLALEYGLPTEVRRLTVEELATVTKPVLVHIETPAAGTGRDAEASGHFLVITKVMPDGEHRGIDTTNALFTSWTPQFFARNATGYCLVIAGESRAWLLSPRGLLPGTSFLLIVALNLVVWLRAEKRASAASHPQVAASPSPAGARGHA